MTSPEHNTPVTTPLSPTDRAAIAHYPVLHRLAILRTEHSWRFMLIHHEGTLDLIAGVRVWPPDGWSDALAIRDLNDAKAFRCDPTGGTVWNRDGSLADVLDGLIDLPPPHQPGAPRLVKATAPTLWTPTTPNDPYSTP